MKLTKRTVEGIRPDPERQLHVSDEELPGFGIRVSPGGAKSYFVQYTNRFRRFRRYTLGRHGIIAAEQARRMAREALSAVAEGRDPQAERQADRDQPTVKELADRYLEEHGKPYTSTHTLRNNRLRLRKHILPKLGGRAVGDVGPNDITRLHRSLASTPGQANQVLALLSIMFNLAERWGLRPDGSNPCRHVQKFKETKRERYLSTEELRRIGQALRLSEAEQSEKPQVILALRLLLLTGARVNEVLTLRWEHVDLERGELRLPTTKTGPKSITLSAAAQDLLRRAPRTSEWVIPSPTADGHWKDLRGPWRRIKAKVSEKEDKVDISDVHLHDLRHSFASIAAGQGIGLQLIGKLLGHTQTSTTERYAHLADDPMHQAADRVGAEIAAVLDDEGGGEVVGLQD